LLDSPAPWPRWSTAKPVQAPQEGEGKAGSRFLPDQGDWVKW
jgi:hypothetical protein